MKKDQRLLQDATRYGQLHGEAQAFGFAAAKVREVANAYAMGSDGSSERERYERLARAFEQEQHRAISRIRGDAK